MITSLAPQFISVDIFHKLQHIGYQAEQNLELYEEGKASLKEAYQNPREIFPPVQLMLTNILFV